jgi:peptidoglycan/LPS O-acetylase OafA/YrhL
MTRKIARDQRSANFTFLGFSAKRFWRLYPALLVTVAVTMLSSSALQMPKTFARSARSALSAMGFSSNMLFLSEDNYFDAAAQEKPLLHTWSLGLEEQFYVVWPVFLRFLTFWEASVVEAGGVALGASMSLAYSAYAWDRPSVRFFVLPSRLCEFAIGGLAAYVFEQSRGVSRRAQEVVAGLGLVSVVVSFFAMDERNLFPSAMYMLPTGGALAVILSPNSYAAELILSNAVMRWLGKVSYSAYLVHWPIYVLTLNVLEEKHIGSIAHVGALFGSTLSAAVALHYGVETTFRFKRSLAQRVGLGAVWIFSVAFAALAVYTEGGQRVMMHPNACAAAEAKIAPPVEETKNVLRPNENILAMWWNPDGTFSKNGTTDEGRGLLWIGASRLGKTRPSAFVFGTSYADHLVPALERLSIFREEAYVEQGHMHGAQTCPLMPRNTAAWLKYPDPSVLTFGMSFSMTRNYKAACAKINAARWQMLDAAAAAASKDRAAPRPVVVNSHRWESTFRSTNTTALRRSIENFFQSLDADLGPLNLRMVTVSTVPQTAHMTLEVKKSKPLNWAPRRSVLPAAAAMAAYFARVASRGQYVDLIRTLCGHELTNEATARCLQRVPADSPDTAAFMYRSDGVHLSTAGSVFLASILNEALH